MNDRSLASFKIIYISTRIDIVSVTKFYLNMIITTLDFLFVINTIVLMLCWNPINGNYFQNKFINIMPTFNCIFLSVGNLNECSSQEYSPLCICHSSYRRTVLTDVFLAKISLSQCNNTDSLHYCYHSEFDPPSFDLIHLIPTLINFAHCLDEINCLHMIRSTERCQACHLTSFARSENDSHPIDDTIDNVSTNICFDLCQHDASCGFLCLNRHAVVSIHCRMCRESNENITCR